MRKSCLVALLVSLMFASPVLGASYQKTDGEIVDPIRCRQTFDIDMVEGCPPGDEGAVHLYPGPNLAPGVVTLDAVLEGANLDSADLQFADLFGADLSDTNLRSANLQFADLTGTDLRNAFLTSADLKFADLFGANLKNANLRDAFLISTDLKFADLSGTDLQFADLRDANLRNAFLISADLRYADLSRTDLRGADLAGTINLGFTLGSPKYDASTDFNSTWLGDENTSFFDPVAAGWVLVPEPSATLLAAGALMTLAGLAVGKRLA